MSLGEKLVATSTSMTRVVDPMHGCVRLDSVAHVNTGMNTGMNTDMNMITHTVTAPSTGGVSMRAGGEDSLHHTAAVLLKTLWVRS